MNHTYFSSSIPTLLIAGSYDTKTAPAQIYPLAQHLGHAYTVLFPTMSHDIIWSGCPANVMSDFLTHPNRKPDMSCAGSMSVVWG